MIIKQRYDGRSVVLCNIDDRPVAIGDTVETVNTRTPYIVEGGRAPHKPGSTGRVWVKDNLDCTHEFYPGVFNLQWRPTP